MRVRVLLTSLLAVGLAGGPPAAAGAVEDPPSPPPVEAPPEPPDEEAAARDLQREARDEGTEADDAAIESHAVTVSASPSAFSPNGDGVKDQTVITVEATEPVSVELEILDEDGATLREWSGAAAPGAPFEVEWKGRAGGPVVPDGPYVARATGTDGLGAVSEDQVGIVVDTKAPRITWKRVWPEPLGDQKWIRFRQRVRDRSPRVELRLVVEDAVSAVGITNVKRNSGVSKIRWRARYEGGGKLFPGNYRTRLRAVDDAGNSKWSTYLPWRVHREVAAKVYTRLVAAGKRVALTFDDCHFSGAWSRILSTLKEKNVTAAFFCPGQQMAAYPGLTRRTVRQGHTIAAHAWDHALLTGKSVSYTSGRLASDRNTAWSIAERTTAPYFRPPYGAYDANVLTGARVSYHPRVMMWDVDPLDWQRPGSGVIRSRVVTGARRGSVILMHTLDQTATALPGIINGLRAKGLKPVGLPTLFRKAGLR